MSEIKFSCSNCGQHLSGEVNWAGRQIECPSCKSTITIPAVLVSAGPQPGRTTPVPPPLPPNAQLPPPLPPSGVAQPGAPAGPRTRPAFPARTPAPPPSQTSPWSVVALVVVLLTLPLSLLNTVVKFPMGLVASIPGVVFAHIALGQIRSRKLQGRGMAVAALIVGYLFIALQALALGIYFYLKATNTGPFQQPPPWSQPREWTRIRPGPSGATPPTSRPPVPQPPPTFRPPQPQPPLRNYPGASNPIPLSPFPRPMPPGTNYMPRFRPPADEPRPATNPRTVAIPAGAVTGTVGGQPFAGANVILQNAVLTFTVPDKRGYMPLAEVVIFLGIGMDQPGTKMWLVPGADFAHTPHIHTRWTESGRHDSNVVMDNYVLRLELGNPAGGQTPGRIYLELPQSHRTRITGTFSARDATIH